MESALENIFTELSRYELLELFYTISGNVTNNITVLITALSAYLALAYIAGKDLSKFQVYSISVIYSAFVLFMIGGISRDFSPRISELSCTSASVKRQYSASTSAFDQRFRWVSMAPFERPVVPDV